MSTPCEEIRPELEALLGAMTEGGLDAPGRRRLAEILHDHPDARQVYLDYCQMHAMLRAAHGELCALDRPRRRRLAWAATAAAVVLGGIGLTQWPAGTGATRDGQRLSLGQSVGNGEIQYRDGSRVALRDRTETAIFPDHVVLHQGVVRCEIRKRSTPFSIKTRQAEATVLGTSFEVASEKDETRLSVASGRVRLASAGREVVAGPGEVATSDGRELTRWTSVCDLKFAGMKELPAEMESVFCLSTLLHAPDRTITAEPLGRFVPGGFHLGTPGHAHGLHVWRWKEAVGDDLLIEADVAGGESWSLGFSMSGDSFEGYRIIFAGLDRYPNGVAIDTIWPRDCVVLAQDPRPIRYDVDHTLRAERRGRRMRVWVDRELRIDTEITHALPEGRRRTFAFSNYGAPPLLRALRVWKAAP
jgi:hypothetical protein